MPSGVTPRRLVTTVESQGVTFTRCAEKRNSEKQKPAGKQRVSVFLVGRALQNNLLKTMN